MASSTNEEAVKIETRATREDLRKQVNDLTETLNLASTKSESRKQILSSELTLSESEKQMLRAKLDTMRAKLDQAELGTLRAKLDQAESDNKTLRSEIDGLKDSMKLERDGLMKEKLELEEKVKSLEIGIEKSKDGSSCRVVKQLNELIKKLEKELTNLDDVGVSNNNNNNNNNNKKKKKMELDNYVFMINELLVNLDHLHKSVSGNVVELERVTKVGEHLMTRVLSSIHVENTVTNKKSDITVVVEKRGFWDVYNSYDDEKKQNFKVFVGFLMFISIFTVVFTCATLLEAKWRE